MERKIREDSKYSQECIIDAFIYLLGEKQLQSITITEICKKAGVARITFYKYFKTLNDVLKAAVDSKFALFREEINHAKQFRNTKYALEVSISTIVTLHKPLKSLAKSKMSGILLQYFTEALLTIIPNIGPSDEYQNSRYLFLCGGVFNILTNWVFKGMKESPKQLADQIYVVAKPYWQ